MGQSKPFDEADAQRYRKHWRVQLAVLRALRAAETVRALLRDDGEQNIELHASLVEGLKSGPLVMH